jgi:PmbA protein
MSVGRESARRAVRLLGSERIETKRYAVLIDGPAFTDIMNLLAEALSAEMVVKGTSLFAGKLGDRIAPRDVTIMDDPFMKGGCFNAGFDAEGVPKSECILVESGELAGYLHNTYSSRRMNVTPTANAVRSSFKGLPLPGPANLYLSPGTRKTADMIAGLSGAIYVQDIMGMHTADPISGDFSVGISGCYIRSGEVAGSIGEMTMSGNILEMLGRIVEVGYERVFIGPYGSPPVIVEDLSVSGT